MSVEVAEGEAGQLVLKLLGDEFDHLLLSLGPDVGGVEEVATEVLFRHVLVPNIPCGLHFKHIIY